MTKPSVYGSFDPEFTRRVLVQLVTEGALFHYGARLSQIAKRPARP